MKNILITIGLILSCLSLEAQLRVADLKVENRYNPIGLDIKKPLFSWVLLSDERNIMQTAYEIEVKDGNSVVWASSRVAAENSVHVPYDGMPLASGKKYTWRVRVWDSKGNRSAWSAPAWWQMALLDPSSEFMAQWITSGLKSDSAFGVVPQFRKQFTVTKNIRSAVAYVTSRGLYEAHINGRRIGNAHLTPGWTSYQKRILYQTYDVTALLKKGMNAVGVLLGNGWYRGGLGFQEKTNVYGDKTALLFQLIVTYEDGSTESIVSDGSWKVSESPVRRSEIYDGEIYDARLEMAGWSLADFDDHEWAHAVIIDLTRNNLFASIHELIEKHERIKPVKVLHTADGKTVLDFGQNLVGWVSLKISGMPGDKITLRHSEILDKYGNPYFENLRNAAATDTYILSGQSEEFLEPHFTFHGFRYVLVDDWKRPVNPDNFTAVVLHSAMKPTGSFECSDARINQLQKNIRWSQKGNFIDVPTDCPQRDERLGWTGDAQVFSRTAAFNFSVQNFFVKWLKDLAADQFENGAIPFIIPDIFRGSLSGKIGTAGWSDAGIIIPWNMYLVYGDKRLLEEQYPSMKAYIEYIKSQARDNLWNTGFQFADWLSYRVDESTEPTGMRSAITDNYLVTQCFYAYSVSLMARIATLTGRTEEAAGYEKLLKDVKSAFRREYMTASGRLISDTQTAYVLALQFDMLPDSLRAQAVQRLVRNIRRYDYHLTTGFLGTPFLNHVLSQNGHTDVAYRLLLQDTYPSWLYPITMGATTIWERWDSQKPDSTFQDPDMTSFNHYAYGAIGDWMYRTIGGIDTYEDGVGYKHSKIKPEIGGNLSYAKATLETYYGKLSCEWKTEGEKVNIVVEIPVNTRATIFLPGSDEMAVKENGRSLRQAGLQVVGKEGNYMIIETGSGRYNFVIGQ